MKRLCDWLIKHERDNVGDFGSRVVIHIPIGIVMSAPVFGWGLIALFIYYQHSEDNWCEDRAWKDVYGAMVGCCIGLAIQVAVACILI